jgi:YHYH protein
MPTGNEKSRRRTAALGGAIALALVVGGVVWAVNRDDSSSGSADRATTTTAAATSTTSGDAAPAVAGATTTLTLDPKRDYGDEYADGILPVGDGKYVTDAPASGSVYVCRAPGGGGGAQTRGPWFVNNDTEYDLSRKVSVQGEVPWTASYSMSIDGDRRIVSTNDVPRDHTTGVFPVAPSDPAYEYDHNPNRIATQSLQYGLDASPTVGANPGCVSGEVGVMTTGVALFDAFDAGGRDAGAWEVQDGCDGHPQMSGEYHYHTLSSCIQDVSVTNVIGFALDGFPITGPKIADGNILTTKDLDACHGITSAIHLDGTSVTMYHYVMTQDFPYSASCFRGTAAQPPRP